MVSLTFIHYDLSYRNPELGVPRTEKEKDAEKI